MAYVEGAEMVRNHSGMYVPFMKVEHNYFDEDENNVVSDVDRVCS